MHSKETDKLKLSQFLPGDTPSWLIEYNDDMKKIDQSIAALESSVQKDIPTNVVSKRGSWGGSASGVFSLVGMFNAVKVGKVWIANLSAKITENRCDASNNILYGISLETLEKTLGVNLQYNSSNQGILQVFGVDGRYLAGKDGDQLGYAGRVFIGTANHPYCTPGRVDRLDGHNSTWVQEHAINAVGNQWVVSCLLLEK